MAAQNMFIKATQEKEDMVSHSKQTQLEITELSKLVEGLNQDKNKLKEEYEQTVHNLNQEIQQLRSQNIFDSHENTNDQDLQELKKENSKLKDIVREVELQMQPLQEMIIDLQSKL